MSARGQAPGGLDQLAHRPHPTAVCGGDGEKVNGGQQLALLSRVGNSTCRATCEKSSHVLGVETTIVIESVGSYASAPAVST